jgi:hypothetical protein
VPAQVPWPLQTSLRVSLWPSLQFAPMGLLVFVQPLPLGVELDSQAVGVQV